MATQRQKDQAIKNLMRAIHVVEAAQNMACVQACKIDHSHINSAKGHIYDVVKRIESDR